MFLFLSITFVASFQLLLSYLISLQLNLVKLRLNRESCQLKWPKNFARNWQHLMQLTWSPFSSRRGERMRCSGTAAPDRLPGPTQAEKTRDKQVPPLFLILTNEPVEDLTKKLRKGKIFANIFQCCGSRIRIFPSRIPDPGSKDSGSLIWILIKEFKVFLTIKPVSKLSENSSGLFFPDPGFRIQIGIFFHLGSRTPVFFIVFVCSRQLLRKMCGIQEGYHSTEY